MPLISSVVVKDLRFEDKDKDLRLEDKDKDLGFEDQDRRKTSGSRTRSRTRTETARGLSVFRMQIHNT